MIKVEMVNIDGKRIENNSAIWEHNPDIEDAYITGMLLPEGYALDSMVQKDSIVFIRMRKI